ncbi:zinc finger protein 180-like, partial [Aphis craccivora]
TTDEEYSENSHLRSEDITDKKTYDNNERVPSEDSKRNLIIPVAWDDHKSKYRAIADTDLYFSGHYTEESNIAYSSTNHENVHIWKSSHGCDVCFRSFISKSKICMHKRTHTGEKPYACNVYGRSFSEKSNLVKHLRTHIEKKPYVCNVCGRLFIVKSTLVRHRSTHTGEKPYTCDICGRSFKRKSYLVEHNRTHTDEKP